MPIEQPKTVDPPIERFLERYRTGTGYTYRSGILHYLDFIAGKRMRGFNTTADEFQAYERFATDYLEGQRDKARDFFLFVKDLEEKQVPPKTANIRYVSVKEWLSFHGIEIDTRTLKDARRMKPKGGRRTDFEYFDKTTIGAILSHGDVRFRAFVLLLASSGVRLGEALALTWHDLTIPDRIKYPEKPAGIYIRQSKTGQSRRVFISREAEQALEEWKKVIPQYRKTAESRAANLGKASNHGKDIIFPVSRTVIYENWDRALRDAGLLNKDAHTGRTRLNIHRLRNFFSVQVASAAGQQVSEVLLGHSDQYGGAYTGRTPEQLEMEYRKAEPGLTISGIVLPNKELEQLRDQVKELTAQVEAARSIDMKIESREDLILEIMKRMKSPKH